MSAAELRHHLSQIGWGQARIEQRLTAIEAELTQANGHASGLTSAQWLKVIAGLALPLAVLLATGNVDLARRLLGL